MNSADIQFTLTDMPGEYQQVNVDVIGVNVILNDSLIELGTNQGIYNLLEFVNGKDTLLVDEGIPTGFISQVRLVLGENNTVMVDSVIHDLKTPGGQQSGLKLNVHEEIVGGESYAYVIDFVVEKSIVETGNGKYILKPVIRVFTEATTGSVSGVVQPAEARPSVMAVMGEDTISSTSADTVSGAFMIRGLSEGSYNLIFDPVDPYQDSILSGIDVLMGQTTVLDTLFFN
ncbi:MAG: DUF4382 domain-containing protein [Bacteroidota bacterium]